MSKQDNIKDAVRALASHPRWPVFLRYLEKREGAHVARLLGEHGKDSDVFRRQGQALEARELLADLHKLALPPEDEESRHKEPTTLA